MEANDLIVLVPVLSVMITCGRGKSLAIDDAKKAQAVH